MTVHRPLLAALVSATIAFALAACAPSRPVRGIDPRPGPPLRIGINSQSPPYCFQQDGYFVGLEIDFSRELSRTLGRPVKIVDMPFDRLIPSLVENRIDIAMAGITRTRLRETRVAFAEPYLASGLIAAMRRSDARRYDTAARALDCSPRYSVVRGTTGERFIREHCWQSTAVIPTSSVDLAFSEVKASRADLFISDAPMIVWMVSADEGDLAILREPLDREDLAWAIRRGDAELLAAVNGALARWELDGTRAAVLDRWVPYWRVFEGYTRKMPPAQR